MIGAFDHLLFAHDWIEHDPDWQAMPALPISATETAPGFVCIHLLENGRGRCGSNVFRLEQAIGRHACIVRRFRWKRP